MVPDAMLPVEMSIPSKTGVRISIVLTIVVTESIASSYASLKLFNEIPMIIIVHTRRLISDIVFLPKDEERLRKSPIIIHMMSISTPSTRAALIS